MKIKIDRLIGPFKGKSLQLDWTQKDLFALRLKVNKQVSNQSLKNSGNHTSLDSICCTRAQQWLHVTVIHNIKILKLT